MMGRVRLAIQESLENRDLVRKRNEDLNNFVWVLDFPLFSLGEETGTIESTHHPFTAPHPDDAKLLEEKRDLFNIRSLVNNLIC